MFNFDDQIVTKNVLMLAEAGNSTFGLEGIVKQMGAKCNARDMRKSLTMKYILGQIPAAQRSNIVSQWYAQSILYYLAAMGVDENGVMTNKPLLLTTRSAATMKLLQNHITGEQMKQIVDNLANRYGGTVPKAVTDFIANNSNLSAEQTSVITNNYIYWALQLFLRTTLLVIDRQRETKDGSISYETGYITANTSLLKKWATNGIFCSEGTIKDRIAESNRIVDRVIGQLEDGTKLLGGKISNVIEKGTHAVAKLVPDRIVDGVQTYTLTVPPSGLDLIGDNAISYMPVGLMQHYCEGMLNTINTSATRGAEMKVARPHYNDVITNYVTVSPDVFRMVFKGVADKKTLDAKLGVRNVLGFNIDTCRMQMLDLSSSIHSSTYYTRINPYRIKSIKPIADYSVIDTTLAQINPMIISQLFAQGIETMSVAGLKSVIKALVEFNSKLGDLKLQQLATATKKDSIVTIVRNDLMSLMSNINYRRQYGYMLQHPKYFGFETADAMIKSLIKGELPKVKTSSDDESTEATTIASKKKAVKLPKVGTPTYVADIKNLLKSLLAEHELLITYVDSKGIQKDYRVSDNKEILAKYLGEDYALKYAGRADRQKALAAYITSKYNTFSQAVVSDVSAWLLKYPIEVSVNKVPVALDASNLKDVTPEAIDAWFATLPSSNKKFTPSTPKPENMFTNRTDALIAGRLSQTFNVNNIQAVYILG